MCNKKYYVRPSSIYDIPPIAAAMREEDVAEVRASSNSSPMEALLNGFNTSLQPYTMIADGSLVGMFGAAPTTLKGVGIVWLLGTNSLPAHKMAFLKRSKEWLMRLHDDFPVLWNVVDMRNTEHIKWLEWLGFEFGTIYEEYGYERRPFREFIRRNNV